jgi:hypothetical protein
MPHACHHHHLGCVLGLGECPQVIGVQQTPLKPVGALQTAAAAATAAVVAAMSCSSVADDLKPPCQLMGEDVPNQKDT